MSTSTFIMSTEMVPSSTTKKAGKIDESTWELHRATITRLYIEKELEGQDGLNNFMAKNHKFFASTSQYEDRFRKWGLRKNLKRKEWPSVVQHVAKRARQGKESEVRLNGTLITKERIERERVRYGLTVDRQVTELRAEDSPLPGDVTICTPPTVCVADDAVHDLQPSSQESVYDQDSYQTLHDNSTQINGSGAGTWRITSCYELEPLREQFRPFAWLDSLDWRRIAHSTIPAQHLIKKSAPISRQIDAMFYPDQQKTCSASTSQNKESHNIGNNTVMIYSIASFLNNTTFSESCTYRMFREIPWSIAIRMFGALPEPIMDVFRERMFAEAIINDDGQLARAMLELGFDLNDKINIDGLRELPQVLAIRMQRLSVAESIVLHLSNIQATEELDSLLHEFLQSIDTNFTGYPSRTLTASGIEFMDVLLSRGAKVTKSCFGLAARRDFKLWKMLTDSNKDGLYGCLQEGLFLDCFRNWFPNITPGSECPSFVRWITEELLRTSARAGSPMDDEIRNALCDIFEAAVNLPLLQGTQRIFETCAVLKIQLLYPRDGEASPQNKLIAQACKSMDLDLVQYWVDTVTLSVVPQYSVPPPRLLDPEPIDSRSLGSPSKLVLDAVAANDLSYVQSVLRCSGRHSTSKINWTEVIEKAASLGNDRISLAIIRAPQLESFYNDSGLLILLYYGRVSSVSAVICDDPKLHQILAPSGIDYEKLDDVLHRNTISWKKRFRISYSTYKSYQVIMRALSYHSILKQDFKLLGWLLENGLEVESLFVGGNTRGRLNHLPPLLGVAAASNNMHMMCYLLEEGAEGSRSCALSWAVKNRANDETITALLDLPVSLENKKRTQARYEALLEAVKASSYLLIHLLSKEVDVNNIAGSAKRRQIPGVTDYNRTAEELNLTPLGEAIVKRDLKATSILLENGGDPNALVVFQGLQETSILTCGAHLERMSGILAAIDTKSLPMVQLLVDRQLRIRLSSRSGPPADLNHSPRLGLLRTPLQRAAEIGCFDIVQYLVEKGAEIDLAPCYGSGTALQLAAMQGHVGIATFLLERGADVNLPPARGPGRTAFEAAAEWSRIDMMSLLMKWGCRLEMDVVNDPDEQYNERGDYHHEPDTDEPAQRFTPTSTQYERAMRFAIRRGHMASKRFVEHLYQQCAWSTSEGYWDPGSFINADQDLVWDSSFWKEFGFEL